MPLDYVILSVDRAVTMQSSNMNSLKKQAFQKLFACRLDLTMHEYRLLRNQHHDLLLFQHSYYAIKSQ